MTDKPITEKSLKTIVNNSLLEFWEKVLEPNLATKDELHKGLSALDKKLSTRIDENSYQIKQLQHSVDDLKADLSDTPTRAEFEKRLKN